MISKDYFTELAFEAHEAIQCKQLKNAISLIKSMVKEAQLFELLTQIEQLDENYTSMLQFIASGGNDPERIKIRYRMMREAYAILLEAECKIRLQIKNGSLAEAAQRLKDRAYSNFADCLERLCDPALKQPERAEVMDDAFDFILITPLFQEELIQQYNRAYELCSIQEKCQLVSALSLSLHEFPDEGKLSLLFQIVKTKEKSIKTRAVTGLFLVIFYYGEELLIYQDLIENIQSEMLHDKELQRLTAEINEALYLIKISEKEKKKLGNTPIPNLLNIVQHTQNQLDDPTNKTEEVEIMQGFAENLKGLNEETKNELNEKIKILLQMERDGLDIHTSVTLPVRKHPFFQTLAHWLLPFDVRHPGMNEICQAFRNSTEILDILVSSMSSQYCDTDRYAILLTLMKSIPADMRDNLQNVMHIGAQDENGNPIEMDWDSLKEIVSRKKEENLPRKYMYQLFRAYTKSGHANELKTPFECDPCWTEYIILGNILKQNVPGLKRIANLAIKYEDFDHAEDYLHAIIEKEGSDVDTLIQMGRCMEYKNKISAALSYYRQAEMLEEDNLFVLDKIQQCYKKLNRDDQRLEYFGKMAKLEPDNWNHVLQMGKCLEDMEHWEEALPHFYRLEVEEQLVETAQREIAWCLLNTRNFPKAIHYYQKLIKAGTHNYQDYMNLGHAYWLSGDMFSALKYYKKQSVLYFKEHNSSCHCNPFNSEIWFLKYMGIDKNEADLMCDLIEL